MGQDPRTTKVVVAHPAQEEMLDEIDQLRRLLASLTPCEGPPKQRIRDELEFGGADPASLRRMISCDTTEGISGDIPEHLSPDLSECFRELVAK